MLIHHHLQSGRGPAAIARALGVSLHICKRISKGKGWRHLAAAPPQSEGGRTPTCRLGHRYGDAIEPWPSCDETCDPRRQSEGGEG